MVDRHLSSDEIKALSLVVASKATTDCDLKKLAQEVFDTYEKSQEIFNELSQSVPSIYEKRGLRTF